MHAEEKAPFRAQAENDKERYEQELVNFKHNGGILTHNGRITKKSRLESKDPNLPKRPRTAFFLFSNENRELVKSRNPDFKTTDVARELGRLWSIAEEEIKAHYQQQSIAEREEYHRKMSVYRQNKAVEAREIQLQRLNETSVTEPIEANLVDNPVTTTSTPITEAGQIIQVHPTNTQQMPQIQVPGNTTTYIVTANQLQFLQSSQNTVSIEHVSIPE